MKTTHLAALLAVAVAVTFGVSSVKACESVDVTVLPFAVAQDFTMPSSELMAASGGVSRFGEVSVRLSASVVGCSVTVGYTKPVMRIARELVRDTCSFQHVVEHEQGHVAIYQAALDTLAARIQARAAEPDLFKAVVQELEAVRPLQAAHDNDDEYHSNVTACSGRILRLAGVR